MSRLHLLKKKNVIFGKRTRRRRFVCEHFHSTSLHFIRFDFTLEIRVTARPLYAFTIIYFCFFFFVYEKNLQRQSLVLPDKQHGILLYGDRRFCFTRLLSSFSPVLLRRAEWTTYITGKAYDLLVEFFIF